MDIPVQPNTDLQRCITLLLKAMKLSCPAGGSGVCPMNNNNDNDNDNADGGDIMIMLMVVIMIMMMMTITIMMIIIIIIIIIIAYTATFLLSDSSSVGIRIISASDIGSG